MKPKAKDTYCPYLWDEAYIDNRGNVFSCCHNKPAVIGNIYNESLEAIYNNSIIQGLRLKSLNGGLECFSGCNMLDKGNIKRSKESATIDYAGLKRIKILFGEACNIRCIMCWQDHSNRVCLNYEKLIANVDITHFEDIEIQGGEPLFIKEAKAFFDYAASRGKKVSFLTNGTLIDDEWADKIALHSSCIYFSLNAASKKTHEAVNRGSRWERVLENIKKVADARARLGTEVRIIGHMTIVKENIKDIHLFIRNFKRIGFDSINFGYDRKVTRYLTWHPHLKSGTSGEIKKALEESSDGGRIDTLRLRCLGLITKVPPKP